MNIPQSIILKGLPISCNSLYFNKRHGRGRAKTEKYRRWIEASVAAIKAQNIQRIEGDVEVNLYFKRPDKRKRDLDNLIKASLDLLVSQGLIDDDRHVVSITAKWTERPEIKGTMIMISKEEGE